MMWPYYPDLLARNVPRYTSYPTAADFRDDIGEPELSDCLSKIGKNEPISLYIHIP